MHSKTHLTIPEEVRRFVHTYLEKIRPALESRDFKEARDYMFPVFMRRGLFVDNSRTSQDVSPRILRVYHGALKYLEEFYRENLDLINAKIVPDILRNVDTRVELLDEGLKNSELFQLTRNGLI